MKKILLILICLLSASNLFAEIISLQIPTRVETESKKYLEADLYTIDTTVAKPVIFIQTPYNKYFYRVISQLPPEASKNNNVFDTINYNIVTMDWRGFYASKEADSAGYDRGLDGYDAIEWIAAQSWCNGKIGTTGSSALGAIQFQTAKHNPPHLVCANPNVKDYKTLYSNYFYGGVYRKEHVEQLQSLGFTTTKLILSQYKYGPLWQFIEKNSDYAEDFEVPMLLISGWFDHYPADVMRAFHDIKNRSAENVRENHKLIFGPWLHSELGMEEQGELKFPNAVDIPKDAIMRFFDYWLLGAKNAWPMEPVIKYYQMGEDEWLTCENWYEEAKTLDTLYLYNGDSIGYVPNPIVTLVAAPDTIHYDPRDPSPTIGGSRFNPSDKDTPMGPLDIRESVESRNDVLVYSTEPLKKALRLKGKTQIELYVASDREDTDFSARLCDVYPDGRSIILTQGIIRMRFRDSFSKEELMKPGQVYQANIELSDLAHTFLPGHKLRLVVSSSNYPMFEINLNNGGELYTAGDTLTATNLLYADNSYHSRIILPVTERITSVKENHVSGLVPIYPNPASNYIYIDLSSIEEGIRKIKIIDIFGNTVKSINDNNNGDRIRLNLADMPNGTYFLQIGTDFDRYVEKIVVVK